MPDQTIADRVARFMSSRDEFAKHLGIELLELKPGYCRVSMRLQPYMMNGLGISHGSIIFSLADFAFAAACNSHGTTAVALSMDIHFLSSPAPDARLECEAVEVKLGRSTGLYRMTVMDSESKLVAELHGMAFRKDENFLER